MKKLIKFLTATAFSALLISANIFTMEEEKFQPKEEFEETELFANLFELPPELQFKIVQETINSAKTIDEVAKIIKILQTLAQADAQLLSLVNDNQIKRTAFAKIKNIFNALRKEIYEKHKKYPALLRDVDPDLVINEIIKHDMLGYFHSFLKSLAIYEANYQNFLSKTIYSNAINSVKLLLSEAPFLIQGEIGKKILNDALITGNENIIKLLINRGMNLNQLDSNGKGLIHNLIEHYEINNNPKSLNALQLFLKNGADPNLRTAAGKTPLEIAIADYSDAELVEILLTNGANPSLATSQGKTHFELAYQIGNQYIIELLEHLQYNI